MSSHRWILAFALVLLGLFTPAHDARANACDVNRGAINCATAPIRSSVDWSFWSAIGDIFIAEEYSSCGVGHDYDQPQDVWLFTCAYSGEVTLQLVQQECNMDLFVLNGGCDSRYNCIESSTNGGRSDDTVLLDCEQGEVYYVVLERKDEDFWFWEDCTRWESFSYTLEVDCREECLDGADNDADGLIDCLDPDCPPCNEDCFDGVDNDFDNLIDCDDPDCTDWPECCDVDNDGYVRAGGICGGDDCNDNPLDNGASINPGKPEIPADGIDSNCDMFEDCFQDLDGDFFGVPTIVPSSSFSCLAQGVSDNPDDCDDTDPNVNPAAPEIIANLVDDNCDGREDCYQDQDNDTYGSANIVTSGSIDCSAAGVTDNADDCDDTKSHVYPGAPEIALSGDDEDCNGLELCYLDSDGDGYGDDTVPPVETTFIDCQGPGVAIQGGDCDDTNPSIYPGAVEQPADGIDQNCDMLETCYRDNDSDGYGTDLGITVQSGDITCSTPGVSTTQDDCNDADPNTYPGAPDPQGDAIDQNCDGLQDCFLDADGDGYGVNTLIPSTAPGCVGPGISPYATDCDDTNPAINPDATEIPLDGVDLDCDGFELCYRDADGDQFGRDEFLPTADFTCTAQGFSDNNEDCNDTLPAGVDIYPGAPDFPLDGVDANCDGFEQCYQDFDNDGFGGTTLVNSTDVTCTSAGVSLNDDDCNDTDFRVKPNATEIVANGVDENCDLLEKCYVDGDGDDYGIIITTLNADLTCTTPGVAANDDDCDDTNPDIHPGAPSQGAGVDWDCTGNPTCYLDSDRDGWGNEDLDPIYDCDRPDVALRGGDCNDANANINPDAFEITNNLRDDDCDGYETCAQDLDLDGYGTTNPQPSMSLTCQEEGVAPWPATAADIDCDDFDDTIFPNAPEFVADGVDSDCNLMELCYEDKDNDTYGVPTTIEVSDLTCVGMGYADNDDDCDDRINGGNPINPGAFDIPANNIDEDCSGVDSCYLDEDLDGFGRNLVIEGPADGRQCDQVEGYSSNAADCLDIPPEGFNVNPNAPEIPGNGIDDDCDLRESCYVDSDDDGWGGTGVQNTPQNQYRCDQVPNLADQGGDCDDTDPQVNPDAAEIPVDGFDQNCDNMEDCYRDADLDTFGTTTTVPSSDLTCTAAGVSPNDDDCYDTPPGGASVNPNAPEVAGNGIDDNCDGQEICWRDADGDGYGGMIQGLTNIVDCTGANYSTRNDDCDDNAAYIHPDAVEIPADGEDWDCDLQEDCYRDNDGDTFGTPTILQHPDYTCQSQGVSSNADDCNDVLPGGNFIFPGATEIPGNGVDEDCDGVETCYADLDGDTWGDGATTTTTPAFDCNAPNAAVRDGDCDDNNEDVNPDAEEIVGDGIDQDCDLVDDCYQDIDRDGFGSDVVIPGRDLTCAFGGESTQAGDCLDSGTLLGVRSADINPSADEVCNEVDDDCNGYIDDDDSGLIAQYYWYPDSDSDGFGATNLEQPACEAPAPGWIDQAGDCDDEDPDVNPDADEICDPNDVDEDCNGLADDMDVDLQGNTVATNAIEWFPDVDGDQFGDMNLGVFSCDPAPNEIDVGGDCLDTNGDVNPDQVEIPYNRLDDDCDPLTPDDDLDGDGYTVLDDGDCNDNPATGFDVNPGASEGLLGNGIDDDCDGTVDDGTNWGDDDGDGYTEASGDCDDADATRHPGAPEVANNVDDDCDGVIDDGTARRDDDQDGWTEQTGDCNDNDPDIHPGMAEIPDNGIDDDCDGSVDGGVFDPDSDGYIDPLDCDETNDQIHPGADEIPNGIDDDCNGIIDDGTTAYDDDGDGYAEDEGDCNDDDENIYPGAPEATVDGSPNGIDDDCDGDIDEGLDNSDDDGDGFSELEGDCNDDDPLVFPGAEEAPNNGIDDDCDGVADENAEDADGDGYTSADGDCDDANGWANPGREEVCDGIDNDCDGFSDEDLPNCEDGNTTTNGGTADTGCNVKSSMTGGPRGATFLLALVAMVGLRRRRRAA